MTKNTIDSGKLTVNDIFSTKWFKIPAYQRPYVWGDEQVTELLEDTHHAMVERGEDEYFMGSFVFKSGESSEGSIKFEENDLLDGQQRMTTLLLLFVVIRDRAISENNQTGDEKLDDLCQEFIFQSASKVKKIPERTRIVFKIRGKAQNFIIDLSKDIGFTNDIAKIKRLSKHEKDTSVKNMAEAILSMHRFFDKCEGLSLDKYLEFILHNVLLVYISAEKFEDAFRFFTILNDRGISLRSSDILKSMNLGKIENENNVDSCAASWENIENELGEEFERFLNYVRTILVKEKARQGLLQEYENKIYNPKGNTSPLMIKGENTFDEINKYFENYQTIVSGDNRDTIGNFKFDNLVKIMFMGLPSTDWIPPLLSYFNKFKENGLIDFLERLDNKFSASWVNRVTPTKRIDTMNGILKKIEITNDYMEIINSSELKFDLAPFLEDLDGNLYARPFAKYILLKLDYILCEHSHKMGHGVISIEHILPQTPEDSSQWKKDFPDDTEREELMHKLGNLVLISRRKNSEQGRLDFAEKKQKYFEKNIDVSPNSLRVLISNDIWTPAELNSNHDECIEKLKTHYSINGG